jgi:hypothetical protein
MNIPELASRFHFPSLPTVRNLFITHQKKFLKAFKRSAGLTLALPDHSSTSPNQPRQCPTNRFSVGDYLHWLIFLRAISDGIRSKVGRSEGVEST